ncbi:hypothetical protein [Wukongibacter sp. M2B1]|uniref:hypothetical protein n=1 Tax=Wukongibacter sp. M2B1 TaxID=3088895 RepID=UPI003D79D403
MKRNMLWIALPIVAFFISFLSNRVFNYWYTTPILIIIYITIVILIYTYKKLK